jgi:hypothetical protein
MSLSRRRCLLLLHGQQCEAAPWIRGASCFEEQDPNVRVADLA